MNPPNQLRLVVSGHDTVLTALPAGTAWVLPVGTSTLWPPAVNGPSAVAIEGAIQVVEDAIERVAGLVPRVPRALVPASVLGPLQWPPAEPIPMDRIERAYQALAARAMGSPSAHGSGFADPAGDALVLILRELMHHLGWTALQMES